MRSCRPTGTSTRPAAISGPETLPALIYPALLWLGLRRSLLILGLGSFILTTRWVQYDSLATFYRLPTRTWELLLGAGIARQPMEIPARWRPLASWTGLLGILAASLLFRDDKLTGLMIIAHRNMDTPGAGWLCSGWLRHLALAHDRALPILATGIHPGLGTSALVLHRLPAGARFLSLCRNALSPAQPKIRCLIQLCFFGLGKWMQLSGGFPQFVDGKDWNHLGPVAL